MRAILGHENLFKKHPQSKRAFPYHIQSSDKIQNKSDTRLNFFTSAFHKKTFTGLLISFNSFCSFSNKVGQIKMLVYHIYKINSSWTGFQDLANLSTSLASNQFPQ